MAHKTLKAHTSTRDFDGGASSRWPATREIESYWYPMWLAYPAGMLERSRMLDQKLAEAIKRANSSIKIAFVGPPVTTSSDRALNVGKEKQGSAYSPSLSSSNERIDGSS